MNKNLITTVRRLTLSCCLLFLLLPCIARADEGMWMPMFLKYNVADMKKKGFKLKAEDLYSINRSSMKDAIVNIRGCTGEMISDQGLLLTNHHCGLGQIQSHSSVEFDYLTNGFWAATLADELPCPGMTAQFVVRMDDVTIDVLKGVAENMDEQARKAQIDTNIKQLVAKETLNNPAYTYTVSSMFDGNQYILFVYELFTDVRLVGAPPAAIGKFGGDTDNWMWPRHTGDFCLFRIYADANNQPAAYSKDNQVYRPKHHFKISLKGIHENDFTLIYGFPGRTMEYLPSYAIKNVVEQSDPHKIRLREMRLDLMKHMMEADPKVRIQYASKSAGVANAWKKWIGELKGLERLNALEKKQGFEKEFAAWAAADPARQQQYGDLLFRFDTLYAKVRPYALADDYYKEAFQAIELIALAARIEKLVDDHRQGKDIRPLQKSLKPVIEAFYKDYHQPYDRRLLVEMLKAYQLYVPEAYRPLALDKLYQAFQDDLDALSETAFSNTLFNKSDQILSLTDTITAEQLTELENDFFYNLWVNVSAEYKQKIAPVLNETTLELAALQRRYMKGQMEMQHKHIFYPDANSTLRVAYGKVGGFRPTDGVIYDYYTTLDGIMEKDNPDIYDYRVPMRLKELWKNKDYGPYATKDGQLPVAFIATNHTTGGNSGSPVLNARGELIGLNFDRCWESTMSDYMFDPDYCRNIAVDIRYVLFLIDKYAQAGRLIDEMTLVK